MAAWSVCFPARRRIGRLAGSPVSTVPHSTVMQAMHPRILSRQYTAGGKRRAIFGMPVANKWRGRKELRDEASYSRDTRLLPGGIGFAKQMDAIVKR